MSRKVRENIISASGDYALFAAGQDVYNDDGSINVLPGQLVFYDPVTRKSLGATTVDVNDRVVIGVGVDTTGDGATDDIRKAFGDKVYGNHIHTVTAEPPRSGTPQIVDLLFSNTDNDEEFSINITVEDDQTQHQFPFNRPSGYTYTVKTDATGTTSTDIACKLVDAINNNNYAEDPSKTSKFNKLAKKKPELPFYAVRLFNNSFTFCLSSVSGACDTCLNIDRLKAVTADGTTTQLNNSANPADSALTLKAQLKGIVKQINTILDGNGHATLTGGAGACPDLQLEINTCHADFALLDENDLAIATCQSYNPFDPITLAKACKNCGAGTSTVTHTAGVRIISKQIDISCNGDTPANPPIGFKGRLLDIFPGGAFASGTTYKSERQKLTLPNNTGYDWQWRDYASQVGGRGRSHDQFASGGYGPLNLPLDRSRMYGSRVKCQTSYCSYILEHGLPSSDLHVHAPTTAARGRTVILVPSSDATTIADLETKLNSYITSATNIVKSSVACGSDQDQDEATPYPDANGYIV